MPNYYSPTVVLPDLPIADINPIEMLMLTAMFDSESAEETAYFFSEEGFRDLPLLEVHEARAALTDSKDGRVAEHIRQRLQQLEPGAVDFEIEDDTLWEQLFQDVIRRSPTLHHIEVLTSYMCTKMRPDGFGGAVTIITAERALSCSTANMACQLLDQAEFGEIGRAPGYGNHVLLQLQEPDVRLKLDEIFALESYDDLLREDVTDADIRTACLAVAAETSLHSEETEAVLDAALAAREIAASRKEATG